jgi:hemolysin III
MDHDTTQRAAGTLSRAEEIANSITHGIGLILSLPAGIFLISRSLAVNDPVLTVGCMAYAFCMVGVYGASTLSHMVASPRWRTFFRTLDQALIYLLIVGTYTPISLAYLRSWPWTALLGAMWAIALVGFVSKIVTAFRVSTLAVWGYVALGWMPVAAAPAVIVAAPAALLWLVMAGGIAYTAGTIFLHLDYKYHHFHAIWHLFVMAGSACHYYAILTYVLGT